MDTVLVVTVGGSCQPVVTAINEYRAQFVYFVVSTGSRGSRNMVDGPGMPCQSFNSPPSPNLLTQTGLGPEQFDLVEIDDPDSLHVCYAKMREALSKAALRFPTWNRVVDYTGGTKSMSVGLVLAALETDWSMSLVKGARTDLVKVVDGTEVAGLVNSWEVRARQRMEEARRLFNDYHFAAAQKVLETTLQLSPVSTELQDKIRAWIGFARAFDAWDRFDHARAAQIFAPFVNVATGELMAFLRRVIREKENNSPGYAPVYDLLNNADRRAALGRYDDAVARLYRALELFAQVRLASLTPPLVASDINISALPAELRPDYEAKRDPLDGRIKLGLRDDFELLVALRDPIGSSYERQANRIKDALKKRNHSILAHGMEPLTLSQYSQMRELVRAFLDDAGKSINLRMVAPQLPSIQEDGLQLRETRTTSVSAQA